MVTGPSTKTKLVFMLTSNTCTDCCSSSTKANTRDHVDLGISLISPSPATLTTIKSECGDPTLISEQCSIPLLHCPGPWSHIYFKHSQRCLGVSGVTCNGRVPFKLRMVCFTPGKGACSYVAFSVQCLSAQVLSYRSWLWSVTRGAPLMGLGHKHYQ